MGYELAEISALLVAERPLAFPATEIEGGAARVRRWLDRAASSRRMRYVGSVAAKPKPLRLIFNPERRHFLSRIAVSFGDGQASQ
jgi:hypothetical protein